MKDLKDLFVPYEIAVQLKEIGFNEPCFKKYIAGCLWSSPTVPEIYENIHPNSSDCLAPTFAQAFRFFREKYNLYTNIDYDWNDEVFRVKIMKQNEDKSCNIIFLKEGEYIKDYDCFEEAELACLDKLIEILKNKQ